MQFAASLLDVDGIKTSIATAASIQTYSGVALNGTLAGYGGHADLCSYPTASASSNAGSYVNGSTVQFVGTYNGVATTRTATVVGTDGNATFVADGPLDIGSVTSIVVAAQVNTSGAWTFGYTGVCPKKDVSGKLRTWFVAGGGTGNLHVSHPAGDNTFATALGVKCEAPITRLYGDCTAIAQIYEL